MNDDEVPEFENVDLNDVVVGGVYPIYGAITDIIEEHEDCVLLQINTNIDATVILDHPGKINFLKERAFEPAIFIAKIVSKGERISVDCQKVVFNKRGAFNIQ